MSKDDFDSNEVRVGEWLRELEEWVSFVQLTKQDSAMIIADVLNGEKQDNGWLDRMSASIDRTVARSQRRIDQLLTHCNGSVS
jgi:hypothetical protein